MWFKKRGGAEALYGAKQCGIAFEFGVVGEILHADDLDMLRVDLFKVSSSTMHSLFERTDLGD